MGCSPCFTVGIGWRCCSPSSTLETYECASDTPNGCTAKQRYRMRGQYKTSVSALQNHQFDTTISQSSAVLPQHENKSVPKATPFTHQPRRTISDFCLRELFGPPLIHRAVEFIRCIWGRNATRTVGNYPMVKITDKYTAVPRHPFSSSTGAGARYVRGAQNIEG